MVRPEKFGHLQLVYHFTIPLIPSYLLKVTKFLGKICPYEFLVMTEKNIFVFFVIKYFRFYFFLCENCKPPPPHSEKNHPPFPLTPLLKVEVLSSPPPHPPFWKFGWRFNCPPPLSRKGAMHTMLKYLYISA